MTQKEQKENVMNDLDTRYAVSIEVCHLLDRFEAEQLAEKIQKRLNDIEEDVYICVSEYTKIRSREVECCGKTD